MSFANINIGTTAGDGTGDPLRVAFNKINLNFANIASGQITVNAPVLSVAGRTGNIVLTYQDVAGTVSNASLATTLSTYTGNISAYSAELTGNSSSGFNGLYVGLQSGYAVVPSLMVQHTANYNTYSQINTQNINAGNQSTTDYVATANNGTNSTNYIDMGIAGSGYDGTQPNNSLGTSLFPNDGYVYAQGSTPGVAGGNLVLGTTVPGTGIKFLAGGVNSANVAVAINNPGTAPTNNATGALVVTGGVGISGNMNVGQYNTSLHNIRGNLLLGLGNVIASADSILTINQNSTTPINAPNNIVHLSAPDGKSGQYGADCFGVNAISGVLLRKARGTSSAPANLVANDPIGIITAKGWGTTGFLSSSTPGTSITFYAGETHSDSAQGTYIQLKTIVNGTTSATTTATFASSATSFNSNTVSIYGNLVVGNVSYTMGNYQNWTQGNVYTVASALDQLAARLKAAGF